MAYAQSNSSVGVASPDQAETADSLSKPRPLPPRRLQRNTPWITLIALTCVLALVGPTIYGAKQVFTGQYGLEYSMMSSCDYVRSSGIERLFVIDRQVIGGLSFAKAKVLSLAWDMCIGQAGRILHGWVFYHTVARVMTWVSEFYAAPYHFHLSILFTHASPESLWSALRVGFTRQKSLRLTFIVIWVIISIGYVLLFPAVWGAAAGYIPNSTSGWNTTSAGFVSRDSPALNFCWVADMDRLGLDGQNVITGPKLQDSNTLEHTTGDFELGDPLWPLTMPQMLSKSNSDAFKNLFAYVRTRESIKNFYTRSFGPCHHWYSTPYSLPDPANLRDSVDWRYLDPNSTCTVPPAYPSYDGMGFEPPYDYPGEYATTGCNFSNKITRRVEGWQYSGVGQMDAQTLTSDVPFFKAQLQRYSNTSSAHTRANLTISQVTYYDICTMDKFSSNMSDVLGSDGDLYSAIFLLDESEPRESLWMMDPVPYNSTLWWEGQAINISAPFLTTGITASNQTCSNTDNNHGLCLCVDDTPITDDDRHNAQRACITESDYIWGFASQMAVLGAIFEVFWLLSCCIMWTLASWNSQLIRNDRPGAGTARNVLDLADAMRTDLGPDTGTYEEKVLGQELEKHGPVGYEVVREKEGDEEGGWRSSTAIRMRSIPSGMRERRTLGLDDNTLYS